MTKKTPEQISYNMKQVKSKGSEIEVLLQKELWRRGLRYRKNAKSIEGKPDRNLRIKSNARRTNVFSEAVSKSERQRSMNAKSLGTGKVIWSSAQKAMKTKLFSP